MRVTPTRTIAVVLILAVVSGCGDPGASVDPTEPASATTEDPEPERPAVTEPSREADYSCVGTAVPESTWAAQEPAVDVEHPARPVLLDNLGPDGLDGWFLLDATDERLAVARERTVALEPGDDTLRTHDVVAVKDFGGETGWHIKQSSSCTPRLVHDDVASADVWLDGRPDPDAPEVALLVVEMSCANGESAEGRVELVGLDEREDAVEVVVGVRPKEGGATCPSNPPTPFTLELQDPLGDRTLIDGSVYPPRPLDAAPAGLLRR